MSEETLLYLIEQFIEVLDFNSEIAKENIGYTLAELSDRKNGSEHKAAAKKMMKILDEGGL